MKDKLKAIWRILRAKSYFYTVHIGDRFVSGHEIGNQPKGGLPAATRVDIMFRELDYLTQAVKLSLIDINHRSCNLQFIDEKPWESNSCSDCKNWGTKDCPNSDKCFSLPSHPYFTPKTEKDGK